MAKSLAVALFLIVAPLAACDKAKDKGATPAAGSAVGSAGSAAATTAGSAADPAGSAAAKPADTAGSAAEKPVTGAIDANWKVFEGPTFTVKAATKPAENTTDVPTDLGPMAMTAYTFQEGDEAKAHAVMTTKLPDSVKGADKAKMLRDARDGMINKYGAKVDKDDEIKIGDTPALDFAAHGDHAQLGKFYVRGRVAIKNHTLYQVMSLGQGHTQQPDSAAFVESFQLK
ncbi:MAG: hypothetical protein H0T42_02635 [Deltaproteobacteria bacterium]|nr:hypothetical protein [Deltaproteobacteria bacterium]